jgi:ABC-type multidrug transport system fused ATPase/permease subunit
MRLLDLAEKGPVYTQCLDALNGLVTIRAFGWQDRFRAKNHQLVDNSQKPWHLQRMIQRLLLLVLDLVTAGLTVLIVGIAVGSIGTGGVAVALVQIISVSGYLNQVINTYTLLETTLGAIWRMKKFQEESTAPNANVDEEQQPLSDWPSKGDVVFDDVTASYNSKDNNLKEGSAEGLALNAVSIRIDAGQKIGICGRTGSGKSPLVIALFGLLDLSSGTISIDGIDISTIYRERVRSKLNGLSQEPYFLSGGTVYDKTWIDTAIICIQIGKTLVTVRKTRSLQKP